MLNKFFDLLLVFFCLFQLDIQAQEKSLFTAHYILESKTEGPELWLASVCFGHRKAVKSFL